MSLGRVHPLRSWSRKKKKSRNIACYLVVVVASNSIRVFVRDGDVLASSCICAGGTSSTRRRRRGSKTNGRRMVYAQPVVGGQVANISRKTGVAELARASRRKLLKRSLPSPSPTYHQKPLVSPPSTPGEPTLQPSPTQFRLAQAPVPSTRWLKPQTDLLCARVVSEQDADERGKKRERGRENCDARNTG